MNFPTLALFSAAILISAVAGEDQVIQSEIEGAATLTVSPENSFSPGKRWMTQKVRIRNTSKRKFFVYGYSPDHAFIQLSILDPESGDWISRGLGYCGTGAGLHRVSAGDAFVIEVCLPEEVADRKFVVEFERYGNAMSQKGITTRTRPLAIKRLSQ